MASRRSHLEDKIDTEEYLIFKCLFEQHVPDYTYEMFANICQNFLVADDALRREFDLLLEIIRNMYKGKVNLVTSSEASEEEDLPQPQSNNLLAVVIQNPGQAVEENQSGMNPTTFRTGKQSAQSQTGHIQNNLNKSFDRDQLQEIAVINEELTQTIS